MPLLDILLIVLIICASAFCIYLIISFRKINSSIEIIQKDIHRISEEALPLIESLKQTSQNASKLIENANTRINDLSDEVRTFKNKVTNFSLIKTKSSIGNPVTDLVKKLRSISNGMKAFWSNLKS
ncbi:MAG: hypothetical protein PVH88_02260 [Ignavibacteria bacterium]|jgi:hypothetical protein